MGEIDRVDIVDGRGNVIRNVESVPDVATWTPIEDAWDKNDLDRCTHGRHSVDPCFNCPGGWSTGNLYLEDGQRIGTSRLGEPIVVKTARPARSAE